MQLMMKLSLQSKPELLSLKCFAKAQRRSLPYSSEAEQKEKVPGTGKLQMLLLEDSSVQEFILFISHSSQQISKFVLTVAMQLMMKLSLQSKPELLSLKCFAKAQRR
ncbi:MAG: hypothetical protein EZS28_045607, partial [Streblomastix strix]